MVIARLCQYPGAWRYEHYLKSSNSISIALQGQYWPTVSSQWLRFSSTKAGVPSHSSIVNSAMWTSSGSRCQDQGRLCCPAPGPGLRLPLGMLAVLSPRWSRKRSSMVFGLVTKTRKLKPTTSNVATTPPLSSSPGLGVGEGVGVGEAVQDIAKGTIANRTAAINFGLKPHLIILATKSPYRTGASQLNSCYR